jgi:single-strand DNA-binding protein
MFNKIILHGRLVRDPERTVTPNGVTICKFTIANNRKTKVRDEVLFIDCTAFNKTAEVCSQYLAKGSTCIISGKLVSEKWTGKDGQEKQKNSILAEEVEFIGRPPQQAAEAPQYQQPPVQAQQPPSYQQRNVTPPMQAAINQATNESVQDDDIPF